MKILIWHLKLVSAHKVKILGVSATGRGGSGTTQIPPPAQISQQQRRARWGNGTRSSDSFGGRSRGSGAARGGYPPPLRGNPPSRPPHCKDHKLAISMEILPKLYRAARHAYSNSAAAKDGPLMEIDLMRHSKALLILCPDMLTAWNSRKMVLSVNYDFTKLKDELQLCALILSYSPKNESTWSHRRWVIKKVSEHNQDVSELIERESVLVKEIAEKSKMNYRAWRHRCWLIPYMTREQVLNELKKSTRWNELNVADNCCFHYRRSLLLALLDSCHVEDTEDSLDRKSEVHLLWKEELTWNQMLIRRYQGRESLWIHRRFLSQWWVKFLLSSEETECAAGTSLVDLFLAQEIYLLSDCLNAPADEFGEACVQTELAALYILWISKSSLCSGNTEEMAMHIVQQRETWPVRHADCCGCGCVLSGALFVPAAQALNM
ncbi:hypothetical protein OsI_03299 [Oryza sativa Indica Group]|uniref:Protein prenyltransferase alpha subunit repeat-containing protein 1 n=1 Tax=Oryza sativa subsp. indica TaxID=39946 RepID=B8A7M3_ORYSI|nr:hypothetical protein OsI_03299 [Oryza sativa Indica Group]